MKKKIIILIIVLIISVVAGMFFTDTYLMKNNLPVKFCTWGKKYEHVKQDVSSTSTEPKTDIENNVEEKTPEYIDNNAVKLSFYVEKENQLIKITEPYYCDWSPENVMGLFFAIPAEENTISNSNFDSMWKEKMYAYENGKDCRIGYNIKFTLENGETFEKTILNPDDAFCTFPKIMTFLYDDVNLVPGKTYYHITQDVMYDYTICSSIKLVGDTETKNISSDITLTAFSFDSEDDFDKDTKQYRGNSSTTITIKKLY